MEREPSIEGCVSPSQQTSSRQWDMAARCSVNTQIKREIPAPRCKNTQRTMKPMWQTCPTLQRVSKEQEDMGTSFKPRHQGRRKKGAELSFHWDVIAAAGSSALQSLKPAASNLEPQTWSLKPAASDLETQTCSLRFESQAGDKLTAVKSSQTRSFFFKCIFFVFTSWRSVFCHKLKAATKYLHNNRRF